MLSVALIQSNPYWEDVTANLAMLEEKLAALAGSADVIVLPEMFSTGFSMDAVRLAETEGLITTRWMKLMAYQYQALVLGSFPVKEGRQYFNRLLAVKPDGSIERYDKRHLFRMGGESELYEKGSERLIVEWKGWKICPLICYDLRFPVWSRNNSDNLFDLLVYVASWPQSRAGVWEILLKARAIENQCYTVGVNRIGADGNGVMHSGDSVAIDYYGNILTNLQDQDTTGLITLSFDDLQSFRKKFPAYLDADPFDLK